MWRIFSRFVKEPLERKLAVKEAKDNNGKNRKCNFSASGCQFVPACLRALNKNECGKEQSFSGERNENEKWKTSSHIENSNSWIEAVGWTGAFVFGWVIRQNLYAKRRDVDEKLLSKCRHFQYSDVPYLLRYVLFAQPANEEESSQVAVEDEPLIGIAFGPPTLDEAIESAKGEIMNAHNEAVAEVETRFGVRSLYGKKYRKAVKHFSAAAALRNATAMFNLAQCFELGLGTKQDFKKAAHYYQKAAKLGHTGAMYNLGVFHAHGWGGLEADAKKARELFHKAADLGHPDAKAALDLEKTKPPSLESLLNQFPDEDPVPYFENDLGAAEDTSNAKFEEVLKDSVSQFNIAANADKTVNDPQNWLLGEVSYPGSSPENFAGICYENGIGVKPNMKKAMELYSTAALGGNSAALCNLASCYEATALYNEDNSYQTQLLMVLYKMAANRGHKYAEERLKSLELHYALGTLKDHFKSVMH